MALQRALSDFGAERSFERASRQLKEHYGVRLHRSSVREVVLQQAERAGGFVEREELLPATRGSAATGLGRRG